MGRQGFLGISLPVGVGGRGLGILGSLIMNEALAQIEDAGPSLGLHIQNEITAYWLATTQQEALRNKYLSQMLGGHLLGCTCDTELTGHMDTTATRDGDELIVTGSKAYIVNAYHADLCFVSLMLDGEMATVLVEKNRPGVRIAKLFDKLGTRCIDSTIVEFADVRVPATNVVSRRGIQQLIHWNMVMTRARFLIGADAYFIHRKTLERMLDYGKRRMIGAKPLASWPINRHALARARADSELMRAGLAEVFAKFQRKQYPVAEAAALKWFCVDRARDFTALCAEMQGGAGYMHDSPFLHAYAQVRGLMMAGGTPTTMKVIANGALACQEEIAAHSTAEAACARM
jgi:alkylation response protein AidB-like acyl-CoA dehydrogenase